MKGNSLTIRSLVICLFALNLTGCAAVVLGGTAMGVKVIHDRRSAGTIVEDQEIWIKAMEAKDSEEQLRQNSNIDITVFNLQVLLTGEAANKEIVEAFRQRVAAIPRVRAVFNEVAIGAESTWGEATADAYLTTKVKLALFDVQIEGFDPTRVKVTSSQGSVYLMGLLTPTEADAVTEKTRFVSGVKRVVKLFEYIDE
jgi:osmotically-inducible protein OsmY